LELDNAISFIPGNPNAMVTFQLNAASKEWHAQYDGSAVLAKDSLQIIPYFSQHKFR
jgi:hypothetical protein